MYCTLQQTCGQNLTSRHAVRASHSSRHQRLADLCRLRSVLPQAADNLSSAAQALTDLEKLIEMLSVWEVGQGCKTTSVSVSPFMLIPSKEYQNIIFQISVWVDRAGESDAVEECVCTGGCYSSFLDETWPWQLRNEQIPAPLVRFHADLDGLPSAMTS
jgi:hypothetical protein